MHPFPPEAVFTDLGLVVEVRYLERTGHGLRHASYRRARTSIGEAAGREGHVASRATLVHGR